MDIDASATASREPVASRDTALACFVQLAVQNGLDPDAAAAILPPNMRDSDSLPVSGLIELARELGYLARHARTDWRNLQSIGFADPILVLLRNTNVVILTGGGREGAEEVAVWDPLHRDSELLYVPRQEFERAWSGDLLRLTPHSSGMSAPLPYSPAAAAEQAPDPGEHQPSGTGRRPSSAVRLCLLAVVILAPVSVGLFLFRTPAEHSVPAAASPGRASERMNAAAVPETRTFSSDQQVTSEAATSAAPKPNEQPSETATAAPALSEEHNAAEANRMAAVPQERTGLGQGRVPESLRAGPNPVIPPASGEVNPETDPNASTAAPIIPPPDATLTAAEISTLLTLGDKSFSSGDVASARLYYGRAANAGNGEATLRLGETFDPVFLEHAHLRSARGDLTAALSWYRRARDMGVGEAEVLLNSLEAK